MNTTLRLVLTLAMLFTFVRVRCFAQDLPLSEGDRIVFLGDSITSANKWAHYVTSYLHLMHPRLKLHIQTEGRGGSALAESSLNPPSLAPEPSNPTGERYPKRVAPYHPKFVFVMHGHNGGLSPEEYKADYEWLINQHIVGQSGARPILVGSHPQSVPDGKSILGDYAAKIIEISNAGGYRYSDTWNALLPIFTNVANKVMLEYPGTQNAPVTHPGTAGHILIAYQVIQNLGFTTFVSEASIDALSKAVISSGKCKVSNISSNAYGGIDFVRLDERLPWAVDEHDPNDGPRQAVLMNPQLLGWQKYMLKVLSLAEGEYDIWINSVKVATVPSARLAEGWNMADLAVGPVHAKAQDVLLKIRDMHNRGVSRYVSNARVSYEVDGNRGAAHESALAVPLLELNNFDAAIHEAALPVELKFSIRSKGTSSGTGSGEKDPLTDPGHHPGYVFSPVKSARLDFPSVDSPVRTVLYTNDTLYLGGSFSRIGSGTGSGLLVSVPSASFSFEGIRANGSIDAVVPDSAGGWFVGGTFTTVGGVSRSNLARIRPDGNLDQAWSGTANGPVTTLAVAGNTLYVGGNFTRLLNQNRSRLGALNTASGAITTWNPGSSGPITSIAVAGTRVFVSGNFTNIGGLGRTNLASLDAASGSATGWNPSPNGTVAALAVSGTTVFIGGQFTQVGGQPRNNFAALNSFTGGVLTPQPNPDGPVRALVLTADRVFVGGAFSTIGGVGRTNVASLSPTSGEVSSWSADVRTPVNSLSVDDTHLHVGAELGTDASAQNYQAYSLVNGTPLMARPPQPSGDVKIVSSVPGTVFVGGQFILTNSKLRRGLAALEPDTGEILPFDAQLTRGSSSSAPAVNTIAYHNGLIFAGGDFDQSHKESHTNLVALDAVSGIPMFWDANPDRTVVALLPVGDNLVVAGRFSSIQGLGRTNLASVSLSTGELGSWAPNPNGIVNTLALSTNGVLHVGGSFTVIAGETRGRLAAFDSVTQALLPWDPFSNGDVETLAIQGNTVFVGGAFVSIGGESRTNLAALTCDVGNATEWVSNAGGRVRNLLVNGDQLYVCGEFTRIGEESRNRAAMLSTSNAEVLAWEPDFFPNVSSIALAGEQVIAGGEFSAVAGTLQPGIAAFRQQGYAVLTSEVLTNGNFQIRLLGNNNELYALQLSTNLVDWTTVVTNRAVSGVFTFSESLTHSTGGLRAFRTIPVLQP